MPISVVVVDSVWKKAEPVFAQAHDIAFHRSAPGEAAVCEAVSRCRARAVVLGVECYADALYQALPAGGLIARFGVGHDGIDKAKASAAGLLVTNTPGVLEDAVAEHAAALILAVAKNLPAHVLNGRAGEWQPCLGIELRGKRLAVIGCGAIGRRLARIAAAGLGMEVVGCEVAATDPEALRREWGFARVTADFGEAVAGARFVSLHIPAVAETHHFVDAGRLARLTPTAVLVNTARGRVVDELALYDALAAGRLAGAALDVFEEEPYVPRDPARDLRRLPNVLLTPHVGSSTVEACARMAERVLRNLRLARDGHPAECDLVNRVTGAGRD